VSLRRNSLAFAAAGLLLLSMAGCAHSPRASAIPTRTRGATVTGGASSDSSGVLDAPQARAAVSSLRHAIVNGKRSSDRWLSAQSDGSFVATGYIADSWSGEAPRLLMGLEIPESVGGYTLYHVVPLLWNDSTSSTVDGRPRSAAELFPSIPKGVPFDHTRYRVGARFSVHNGWIHADALAFTSKDTTPGQFGSGASWSYEYPFESVPEAHLALDATAPAAPSPWLDVSDSPGWPPFMLTGWVNGFGSSGDTMVAAVNVPDHLGPAAIYHLAPVEYANGSQAPSALTASGSPDDRPFHYPVRLRDGHLVAVAPALR
jgi:hypothetical protein